MMCNAFSGNGVVAVFRVQKTDDARPFCLLFERRPMASLLVRFVGFFSNLLKVMNELWSGLKEHANVRIIKLSSSNPKSNQCVS